MTGRDAYIALNMMKGIGPVGVRAMAEALGSVESIFSAAENDLSRARGIGPELAGGVVQQRDRVDPGAEESRAEAIGVRIITPVDPDYPARLLKIHDPPLALYIRGNLQERDSHAIAVVGTRRPSHYGRDISEKIARQLSRSGLSVVSGLAEGIDTCAHRGALKGGGRTLAVLGGGLDAIYPRSNVALAEEVALQGAVMTELPLGRKPDKTTFPMRNRIVSGLAMGVLVVEAGQRSGALITVHQALEQGRTVFAVPGRIDSYASQGCHALLRDGATLVRSVEDILDEFEFLLSPLERLAAEGSRPRPSLSDDEEALLDALQDGQADVDSLIRVSGLPASVVSGLLIGLEMKKLVRMLPGRSVERIRV